jgi:hypothetical protein
VDTAARYTQLERRLRRKVLADHLPVLVAIMAWLAFARWTLYGWVVTLFEHAANGVAALRGVLARVHAAQGWRPVSQLPRV